MFNKRKLLLSTGLANQESKSANESLNRAKDSCKDVSKHVQDLPKRSPLPISLLLIITLLYFSTVTFGAPTAVDDPNISTDAETDVVIDVLSNDTVPVGRTIDNSSVAIVQNGDNVADFDGIDDHIGWANLGLNGTGIISKFIRFRTTDTQAVLFDVNFGAGVDAGLYIASGSLWTRVNFINDGVRIKFTASGAVASDGNWHTAGFTYDGVKLRTWFDGAQAGSPFEIASDTIRHNFISRCGRRTTSNSFFFNGQLSDFVVYSTKLVAAEIADFHNGIVSQNGLVLWGRMNDSDFSGGLVDSSGNGNDGTANGGVAALFDADTPESPSFGGITNINAVTGAITYSPAPGFSGTDTFQYTVDDDLGDTSNPATVTVTVEAGVQPGVCYATTGFGSGSGSDLITIDTTTGAGTLIGPTGRTAISGLAFNSSGELFGYDTFAGEIVGISPSTGAAISSVATSLISVDALAFNDSDVLFGVDAFNDLYTINVSTGAATLIGNTGVVIAGMAFNPTDGTLWGSAGGAFDGATNRDAIFTINTTTGVATQVGKTGLTSLGNATPDLFFNADSDLFGTKGGGGETSNFLISISTGTGVGTSIGEIGFTSVSGLALFIE